MSSLDQLWAGWRGEYIEGVTSAPPDVDPSGCVFCRILSSGQPDADAFIVWRHPSGRAIAILNAYPYTSGHLMIMPARHVGGLDELDAEEGMAIWQGLTEAVVALRAAYRPDGFNVGANLGKAAGAGVPGHFHMHVVPRWNGDTNFMTSVASARVLPEALPVSAAKVRAGWEAL